MRTVLWIVSIWLLVAGPAFADKTHPRMNEAKNLLRTAATSVDPVKTLKEVQGLLKPSGKPKNAFRVQAMKLVDEAIVNFQGKKYSDAQRSIEKALAQVDKAIAADP